MALPYIQGQLSAVRSTVDGIFANLYPKLSAPHIDLHGKNVVITGGNSGIGLETAVALASMGANVIIACRNPERAMAAVKDIQRRTGSSCVDWMQLDCSSLTSTEDFCKAWKTRKDSRIHYLILNAGLLNKTKVLTGDGLESTYQVNFLSGFLTALRLLPCLAKDARIVSTASMGCTLSDVLKADNGSSSDWLDKFDAGQPFSAFTGFALYARSKAAQVVFTQELQKKLDRHPDTRNITAHCCHPGTVKSEIWTQETTVSAAGVISAVNVIGITAEQGAVTNVFLCTSDKPLQPGSRGRFWDQTALRWSPGWIVSRDHTALWQSWLRDARIDKDPLT
ncbi:uncharacterized protein L969DRAFT_93580 [Mixia osmundae IAM 14324]|uniref:Uncharacterized protein n=1 Tax=Mixia osmundae (strain CBS 9802 / IAM 14324 / JCM 22182 / KY 12970) TaxID=764103 RepID=G7DUD8_MIXOS|nr:uncharacterized protein L969DRAFT_93580 [Mixia osmundae IAM 14324]KEI41070.1 hypothetical protein L969DRAFT_93580 [Mixia osmundae IAM 14324]GAA94198.1 hypothetical protein E5Q_00846 [Mixia osmundae IAM 14324]